MARVRKLLKIFVIAIRIDSFSKVRYNIDNRFRRRSMGDISVEKEVIYKPAKESVRVPYAIYLNLLRVVPKG